MADSSALSRDIEPWVRDKWLPKQPGFRGMKFTRCKLRLDSGGEFEFDAVDASRRVAVCISTSNAKTASGKEKTGAIHKIRSDMFFLLLAEVDQRVVVFTDKTLFDRFEDERVRRMRVPKGVRFMHAQLPSHLQGEVEKVRRVSSKEQGGTA